MVIKKNNVDKGFMDRVMQRSDISSISYMNVYHIICIHVTCCYMNAYVMHSSTLIVNVCIPTCQHTDEVDCVCEEMKNWQGDKNVIKMGDCNGRIVSENVCEERNNKEFHLIILFV